MNIDVEWFWNLHLISEYATHPIAQFPSLPALLLLLAWNGHAASSRLAGRLENYTLGCVQMRNLG